MKREPGFYWVKVYGRWQPAELWVNEHKMFPNPELWYVIGLGHNVEVDKLEYIGERIERKDG